MKAELQQLVALQNLDTSIRKLQAELEAIPQRRAEIESEFDQRAFEIKADENHRVLHQIDRYVDEHGLAREVLEAEPLESVTLGEAPDDLDLAAAGITTIVWATGYRRIYDWLDVPVLDARGEIRQRRGVTPMPGLYAGAMVPSTTGAALATRAMSGSSTSPPATTCIRP